MLRITVGNNSKRPTIKLEGRLSGPWVGEAERTWLDLLGAEKAHPPIVDLTEVTFISAEGKVLLGEMNRRGAELRAGALMKLTLEQIKQAARRP